MLDKNRLHSHDSVAAGGLSRHRTLAEGVDGPLAGVGAEHHEEVADDGEHERDDAGHLGNEVDDARQDSVDADADVRVQDVVDGCLADRLVPCSACSNKTRHNTWRCFQPSF